MALRKLLSILLIIIASVSHTSAVPNDVQNFFDNIVTLIKVRLLHKKIADARKKKENPFLSKGKSYKPVMQKVYNELCASDETYNFLPVIAQTSDRRAVEITQENLCETNLELIEKMVIKSIITLLRRKEVDYWVTCNNWQPHLQAFSFENVQETLTHYVDKRQMPVDIKNILDLPQIIFSKDAMSATIYASNTPTTTFTAPAITLYEKFNVHGQPEGQSIMTECTFIGFPQVIDKKTICLTCTTPSWQKKINLRYCLQYKESTWLVKTVERL